MTLLEVAGFSFALIGVILSMLQIRWAWIANIVASIFYFYGFYSIQLMADAYLQWVFVAAGLYGFVQWSNPAYNDLSSVSKLNMKEWAAALSLSIFITLIIGTVLILNANSSYVWWDSILTSASIVATGLAIFKKIENWLWWVIIDLSYMPLYYIKGYQLSTLLYGIYVILAIIAYREWKKHLLHV